MYSPIRDACIRSQVDILERLAFELPEVILYLWTLTLGLDFFDNARAADQTRPCASVHAFVSLKGVETVWCATQFLREHTGHHPSGAKMWHKVYLVEYILLLISFVLRMLALLGAESSCVAHYGSIAVTNGWRGGLNEIGRRVGGGGRLAKKQKPSCGLPSSEPLETVRHTD